MVSFLEQESLFLTIAVQGFFVGFEVLDETAFSRKCYPLPVFYEEHPFLE